MWLPLAIIGFSAGVLGGLTNLYTELLELERAGLKRRRNTRPGEAGTPPHLTRIAAVAYVLQGIVAAFVLIALWAALSGAEFDALSSTLRVRVLLFGLGIGAARFGDRFSSPVLRRMLREVEENKEVAKELVAFHTEPSGDSQSLHARALAKIGGDGPGGATEGKVRVLDALRSSRYLYRSVAGLLDDTGMSEQELRGTLKALQADGVVRSVHTEDGDEHWALRRDDGA